MRKSKREKTKNFVNMVVVPAITALLLGWLFGRDTMNNISSPLSWFVITFLTNNGLYKVVETLKPSKLKQEDNA